MTFTIAEATGDSFATANAAIINLCTTAADAGTVIYIAETVTVTFRDSVTATDIAFVQYISFTVTESIGNSITVTYTAGIQFCITTADTCAVQDMALTITETILDSVTTANAACIQYIPFTVTESIRDSFTAADTTDIHFCIAAADTCTIFHSGSKANISAIHSSIIAITDAAVVNFYCQAAGIKIIQQC